MKKLVMLVAALMAVAFVGLNYESTAYANDRAIPSIGVSGGVGSISVVWTTPAEAPYDYRLAWGLNGGYISYKASNTSTAGNAYPGWSATSYTISGLDPGTYNVKLRARYDGSAGSWKAASSVVVTGDAPPVVVVVPDPTAEPEPPTSEQQQADPPAAPTGLMASQVAHDSVTLTWSDPENTSITGYRILRGTETGKLSVVAQDTGSADTEYTDSTVAAETTYHYAVLALSQDGDGAQSATASATTPAAPASDKDDPKKGDPPLRLTRAAPGVPLNLAVVLGDAQLTFTWDPPTSDGGSTIVRYNYEFGPTGGTLADENHGTNPTGSQSLTKTGLTNGTAYTFKVRAVNMSGGSTTVGTYTAVVNATPRTVPEVTVWFEAVAYNAAEGGSVSVAVRLSADPNRTVAIPITTTNQGGASAADYSGVPASLTFNSGETFKTFRFLATQDTVDDDDESVKLGFGTLPARVSSGRPNEATVNIADDDVPMVTVQFTQATKSIDEGSRFNVEVTLSADPERTVEIPIWKNHGGGASNDDYFMGTLRRVTFMPGQTLKEFGFFAHRDGDADPNETVTLRLGQALTPLHPTGFQHRDPNVSHGTTNATTITINDVVRTNYVDFGEVNYETHEFPQAVYTVLEGRSVDVRVLLRDYPRSNVTIPIMKANWAGASASDYSGVPDAVTFNTNEKSKTITFVAINDSERDHIFQSHANEQVLLYFGNLPPGYRGGASRFALITINDDD